MLFSGIFALALVAGLIVTAATGSFLSLQWLWVLPVSFVGVALGLWLGLFLLLVVLAWCVDPKKPQQEDSTFYRRLITAVAIAAKPVLRVELHTDGLETMLKKGRFLLVCNHLSVMDPVILIGSFAPYQVNRQKRYNNYYCKCNNRDPPRRDITIWDKIINFNHSYNRQRNCYRKTYYYRHQ